MLAAQSLLAVTSDPTKMAADAPCRVERGGRRWAQVTCFHKGSDVGHLFTAVINLEYQRTNSIAYIKHNEGMLASALLMATSYATAATANHSGHRENNATDGFGQCSCHIDCRGQC